MHATTKHADGYFHLRTPVPINADKYHRLTFRYRYDGPFSFGLGTMSRFIWSPINSYTSQHIGKYSTIDDIVTYPRWTTYTIDLKKAKLDAGTIGWNGKQTVFRFDPLEVPQPRRVHIDNIRLSADDWANRGMTIQWREGRKIPRPTRVALFYDTNRSGFDGKLIARALRSESGHNSYKWRTSSVPEGRYWVYLVATDGVSAAKTYSTGPVVIDH